MRPTPFYLNIAEDAYRFRTELDRRDIVSSYTGPMTDDILSSLGNSLRTKMEFDEADSKTSRGVFSALVEQAQNIMRYSAETQAPPTGHELPEGQTSEDISLRFGMVLIGRVDLGAWFVSCSNVIDNSAIPRLRANISSLQGLDRKELAAMMKEQLRDGPPEGSKGAGVGWITIARDASGGFEFDFFPILGTDKSYFTFKAYFK
jgi:hypothetical protein